MKECLQTLPQITPNDVRLPIPLICDVSVESGEFTRDNSLPPVGLGSCVWSNITCAGLVPSETAIVTASIQTR